ncbi:MAG: LysR family transcriptional regulator [Silvanigrellales bacterium]|nr:LysR family transcriptional regulator [Silvanigrellales bacterium]
MLLLNSVETFLVVVEAGSFSRAADRLGMTVSGVGKHMKALEAEVGVPLFRKEAGRPLLTSAGEVLAVDLARTSASLARSVARAKERASVARKTWVIAAPPLFTSHVLMPLFASMEAVANEKQRTFPPIALRTSHDLEDLSLGKIDLAFRFATRIPEGPYVSHFVGEDGKIFCTAVGTPASNEILVSSEGDLQTPLALPGGGKLIRSTRWTFNGMDTFLSAVAAGLGTGLLPTYLVNEKILQGQFSHAHVPLRVEGRGLFAFVHEESAESPFVEALLGRVKEDWRIKHSL